ncbi:hypothetical protein, partial [Parvibacter caecicola]|uniref:hypothetical protein n=1 Tax=Parvibacter caecicola TaxID=747645 RepID=UPI0023F2BE7E
PRDAPAALLSRAAQGIILAAFKSIARTFFKKFCSGENCLLCIAIPLRCTARTKSVEEIN